MRRTSATRRTTTFLGTSAVVMALMASIMSLPASAGASPSITNFNPTSGSIGTSVTINGTGFVGASSVRFNGTSAGFSVNAGGTQILTTVPSGATTGSITVMNPSGTATSGGTFTVTVGAPIITGLNPTSGGVGQSVSINGSRFAGTFSVRFNGVGAGFTVNGAGTQITTSVPAGATTGKVAVQTPGGTTLSAGNFTVQGPGAPSISTFSPTFGPIGTTVTINGTRFSGVTSVRFRGVAASFNFVSDSRVAATVPPGAADGKIALTTPAGTATSATIFNVVTLTVPSITGFTPHNGRVGTSVSIFGSGFFGTTAVRFNGTAVGSFVVVTNSKITTTVPSGATTGPITVTNPMGTATTAASFFVAGPQITGFSPASGGAGTTVTIRGSGFTGVTAVRFNGRAAASFARVSDGQVTAVVPKGATTGRISVVTASGTGLSGASFTVIAPHPRSVSLSLQGRRPAATGNVTALDGFDACERHVPVVIKRFKHGRWRWVATTSTRDDGGYRVRVGGRSGKYRAQARRIQLANGATCGGDRSNIIVRRR